MASLGVVKYAGLRLTLEGGDEFTRQLKDAQHASKLAAGELKLLREQTKFTGQGTKELGDRVKFLSDRYKAQEAELKANNELLRKAREMHGANSEEVRKLEQKEVQLKTALEKTSNQLDWANQKLEEQQSKLFQVGQSLQDFGEKWTKAGTKMKDVGRSMTRHVTAPIMAGMGLSVKAAMDFESAMTGVQKTTNLTGPELDALGESIRNMAKELPSSTTDIAAVAEAAGQLGIEKDNIMDFTKVVIDLANATNIVGEQGAQDMARFANIMGMSQKDFDRFGSTIVDLGNNSATTEAEILAMAMRLAGAGKQAGLSEADVLGMGTALSSLGIRAEAGGSAFSKVMTQMQVAVETNSSQLEDFARISGMTTKEFVRAWEDDAAGAIESFIIGLGDMDKHGKSATVMLDEMGITELRMADALRRTSGAQTLVTDSIKMANEAWGENTALTEEANLRYGTSESQLLIQKNRLQDVAITVGKQLLPHVVSLVEGIGDLISKFNDLDPKTQDTIIKLGLIAAALGPVLSLTGNAVHTIGGISSAVGKLLPNLGKGTGLIGLLSGPVGLVALVGAAAGVIYLAYENTKKLDPQVQKALDNIKQLGEQHQSANTQIDATVGLTKNYWAELDKLIQKENQTAEEKEKIKILVGELNKVIPDLNLQYNEQTGLLNMNNREMERVISNMEKEMRMAANREYLMELYREEGNIKRTLAGRDEELNTKKSRLAELLKEIQGYYYEDIRIGPMRDQIAKKEAGATQLSTEAYAKKVYQLTLLREAIGDDETAIKGLQGALTNIARQSKRTLEEVTEGMLETSSNTSRAGVALIDGVIVGMQSRESAAKTEAGRISRVVISEMNRSFVVRSPSRKTYWMGEMLVQGLADGMSDNLRMLDHVAEDMAGSILGAMQTAQDMQLRQAVAKFSSPEVVSRMQVQVQSERPISSTVQVDQLVVREEADIEKVAHALKNLEQRNLRGIGVA